MRRDTEPNENELPAYTDFLQVSQMPFVCADEPKYCALNVGDLALTHTA